MDILMCQSMPLDYGKKVDSYMKGLIKWLVNNIQHPNFLLQLLQHFAKAETYFFFPKGNHLC